MSELEQDDLRNYSLKPYEFTQYFRVMCSIDIKL
ncbi:hypothetical protein QE431_003227 [Flavobacterium sp. SORGH_AS 622]|nr:hypothetical protein [Flavobacterium sp. SORGH_AS_0622]